MLITRWQRLEDTFSEMHRLQREMRSFFGRKSLNDSDRCRRIAPSCPAMNVWQDEDNLYVEAELPGLDLDAVEIFVTGDNLLSIKGKREMPTIENGTWHRQERGFRRFDRSIELPHDVEADKVEASLHNGVLTITLPKLEAVKPRRITVKAN